MIPLIGSMTAPPGLRSARPAGAVAPSPADTVTLSERPARVSLAVRLGSALAAAMAVGTALAAPPPAAAAAVTRTQCNERSVLTDGLLSRGYRGRPVPAEVRRQVQRDLEPVPVEILRTLDASGVGVVVLQEGESPLSVGVIRPVTMSYLGDVRALRAQVDRLRATTAPELAREILDLEARLGPAGSQDVDEDRMRLDDLKSAWADEVWVRVMNETRGRAMPRMVLEGEGHFSDLRSGIEPVTLEELAREHGARTPAQVAQFTRLVRELNGPALERAQESFERVEGASDPDRPFQPYLEGVVLPGIYYRGSELLSGHDAVAESVWKSEDRPRGQYFYEGAVNTVVLSPDALSRPEEGRSVVVHELGHALEDAVAEQSPSAFRAYRQQRDEAFDRMVQRDSFPTLYAGASPEEMGADSFAAVQSGQGDLLRGADRQWGQDFQGFLSAAGRLGEQRPPACR